MTTSFSDDYQLWKPNKKIDSQINLFRFHDRYDQENLEIYFIENKEFAERTDHIGE